MTVRTITGNINTLAGADIPNGTFSLVPETYVFGSTSTDVVFGDQITVTADSSGNVSFPLHEGKYIGRISTTQGSKSFRLTVDSEGPWTLGRLVGPLGDFSPSLLSQIFDARDTAQAAAAQSVALQSAVQIRPVVGNRTAQLIDAGYLLTFSGAATLTIPAQASVAWPAGTVIAAAQLGAATLTISGAAGVTIVAAGPTTFGQGQAVTLIRTAENQWLALGDFTA